MTTIDRTTCVILGGGGHAAVLIECIRAAEQDVALVVLEADESRWGRDLLGVPVVGGDDKLPQLVRDGVERFAIGLGTTGTGEHRARLFDLALSYGMLPLGVAHPQAFVSPSAQLAAGCQLLAGCIVNTRANLGVNVIINCGAIVEHDCHLSAHAHVATGARLAGNVRIGEQSFVGLGASIRQGVHLGRNVIVGAGAVVVRDVPDNVTVVGVPADVLRRMKQ